MLTYSQNFEDVILARLFLEQKSGYYIDVGASHPETLSVTKHFYDMGWSGINIEPIPRLHSQFMLCRPRDTNLNVAIDATLGMRQFYEDSEYDALSTFDLEQANFLKASGHNLKEYSVPTLTLSQVFSEYVDRVVDFLKIDVEGSEELVLKSLDFQKYRPRVLIIEAMQPARSFPGWGNHQAVSNWHWEKLVLESGYLFAYYDGISRFYVRLEDDNLLSRFELPPGCFDDIHRPEEYRLSKQVESLTLSLEKTKSQLAVVKLELDKLDLENIELKRYMTQSNIAKLKEKCSAFGFRIKSRLKTAAKQLLGLQPNLCLPEKLPLISVVTPVYNGEKYIRETIESVLNQVYPNVEYIIVDGGSTDRTVEIVNEYLNNDNFRHKIAHFISEQDQGMYDALGKGFDHASGDIFCYLNSDDLFECSGLMTVGRYFANNPKKMLIYHEDVVQIDCWKFPNVKQPSNVTTAHLLNGHILFQDGVFFRRSAYEAVGGIDRSLRLAGDFDLWLRLSARFKFTRMESHASCFRVSEGQLSSNLHLYEKEMNLSICRFLAENPLFRLAIYANKFSRFFRIFKFSKSHDRLFYPADFSAIPRLLPANVVDNNCSPVSPIGGESVDRLLFSSPDTRFGENDINHIYYDSRHGIAVCHPPIESLKLDELYRKYYSCPPTEICLPTGYSPYRHYDGMKTWEKLLNKLPIERLARFFPRLWSDNTLQELCKVLSKSGLTISQNLKILDAGCFEGRLLSEISNQTVWQAYGIEPNQDAVAVATSLGHQVWRGHAEDAPWIVPEDLKFDVIYMGQSIEHVQNPVLTLRRLRLLLAPSGVIVISTPNLDSRQIDWFGPTWAHWHPPYHRHIFSRQGLYSLSHEVGLSVVQFMTFSHPYWTTMSLAQNWLGLGGSTSHAVDFDRAFCVRAQRITVWNRVLWDPLGKGDYSYIVLKDGIND